MCCNLRKWVGIVIAVVPALLLADTIGYTSGYGPKNSIKLSRPTIVWEVWPGSENKLTDIKMTLNGTQVPALYSAEGKKLTWTPKLPLQPGDYKVSCVAKIDDFMPLKREWNFSIDSHANPELGEPTQLQLEILGIANKFRQGLGLEDLRPDPRMIAASDAHCRYLSINHRSGHYQVPGKPAFLGSAPYERLEAFGYIDNSWEVVNTGSSEPEDGIRGLFDAPYHRIPFMQPGSLLAGGSLFDRRLTIEFEMTKSRKFVCSPFNGQQDVPSKWRARENPDPLRIHPGAQMPTGYPIVACYFNPQNDPIKLKAFTLETFDGQPIECYLNSPENDPELKYSAILFPKVPLDLGTYKARMEFVSDTGQTLAYSWKYTVNH